MNYKTIYKFFSIRVSHDKSLSFVILLILKIPK